MTRPEVAKVVSITPTSAFRFVVRFADGAWGEWDFSEVAELSGPMVEPLKDADFASRVFLDFGAPTWPNGFDVCPQALYERLQAAGALNRTQAA